MPDREDSIPPAIPDAQEANWYDTLSPSNFIESGFAIVHSAVSNEELCELLDSIESIRNPTAKSAGVRNLLRQCPPVRKFALEAAIQGIAKKLLGLGTKPVRAILFDKTPAANWYVTWHQDLTIPVAQRIEVPGFGPWSEKDGITHVQPPVSVLEKMVSLRIHVDNCSTENGAIKFIPGSHRCGILDSSQIATWRAEHESISCPAERGDVIVMHPLILHSSSEAKKPDHRRVLHIEYTSAQLPDGLDFAET